MVFNMRGDHESIVFFVFGGVINEIAKHQMKQILINIKCVFGIDMNVNSQLVCRNKKMVAFDRFVDYAGNITGCFSKIFNLGFKLFVLKKVR